MRLVEYTGMMLLEEMASIFVAPYLLIFVVPKRVDDILQFIADFTVDVEGVGHVCSFSAFDFPRHGNSNYGSPYNVPRSQRSSQGKMEKSFLSFKSNYPSWDPNTQGRQFLKQLRTFQEQKLQGQGTRHTYSPPRGFGNRNFLSRERPTPGTGYHMGSLWLIDADQKNHPYLLDWYYTSRPHHTAGYTGDIPEEPFEATEQHSADWNPTNFLDNQLKFEDLWAQHYDDRSQSNMGASTSAPFHRESVLQHHDAGTYAHPMQSHWWARTGRHGTQPQASFLEPPDFTQHGKQPQSSFLDPPNFMRQPSDDYHGNFSERSFKEREQEEELEQEQEQEQRLDWRNDQSLSRTRYVDELDLEAGEFNLHFDDVYSTRPPETPEIKQ